MKEKSHQLPPETIGEQIIGANGDGNILFLEEMERTGKFDPLYTTPSER